MGKGSGAIVTYFVKNRKQKTAPSAQTLEAALKLSNVSKSASVCGFEKPPRAVLDNSRSGGYTGQ